MKLFLRLCLVLFGSLVTMGCASHMGGSHLNAATGAEEIKELAFDSHPECYTLPGNSVCSLSLADTYEVVSVVERGDLKKPESIRQIALVARRCISELAGGIFSLREAMPLTDENQEKLAFWRTKLTEWEAYLNGN